MESLRGAMAPYFAPSTGIGISIGPIPHKSWCCTHELLNTNTFSIICIAVGKNRKENKKQSSSAPLLLPYCIGTLLHNLPVKGSILLNFLVFSSIF